MQPRTFAPFFGYDWRDLRAFLRWDESVVEVAVLEGDLPGISRSVIWVLAWSRSDGFRSRCKSARFRLSHFDIGILDHRGRRGSFRLLRGGFAFPFALSEAIAIKISVSRGSPQRG